MTLGRIMTQGQGAIMDKYMSDRMQYHTQTGPGYADPYQTHQYQAYQPQQGHAQGHPAMSPGGYGGMPVQQYVMHKGGHSSGKHHGGGGHGKHGAALSALTLLAFMFFLNILQNCLRDHMLSMNPEVTVMTAGQKREETLGIAENSNQVVETQRVKPTSTAMFSKDRENVYSIFKIDRVTKPRKANPSRNSENDHVQENRSLSEINAKTQRKPVKIEVT